MPLPIERAMHILRGIEVSIGLVVTDGTPEQLSPFHFDAFAAMGREPVNLNKGVTPSARLQNRA